MDEERPYVLGTHDEEVQRLGLQHRAWRRQVLEAWRRAGISEGHTVLDVGCGPGHATLDLAEIVGPTGHVVALDRSRRFLDVLQGSARARGLGNVAIHPVDFDLGDLPDVRAGAAWCRWILAFVARPRELLERVCAALEPGGAIVIHEYFDYGTWRIGPQCPELSEFVAAVMRSWRDAGGEPDVASRFRSGCARSASSRRRAPSWRSWRRETVSGAGCGPSSRAGGGAWSSCDT
jgi:ubiquinone/menaquinone biosynthesis C-methylase UbiE